MDATPQNLRDQGFELEQYRVNGATGEGRINWPTGFAGTGWALKKDGEVIFRHAFRYDVIAYAESATTREP